MLSTCGRSFVVGAMCLLSPTTAAAQQPHPAVIVVSGMAERQVPADSVVLQVSWYLKSADAAAQSAEDSEALDSLVALLRRSGATSPSIHFARERWYPLMEPDSPERPRELRRVVSAHVVGRESITKAMAALRNHPIFHAEGTDYACTCGDSVRTHMLRQAFEVSRVRAMALADAAGTRLVGIVAMSTEPLDAQTLMGYQSVRMTGSGIEANQSLLVPPALAASDGLAAPLVPVVAGVYVAWEVQR